MGLSFNQEIIVVCIIWQIFNLINAHSPPHQSDNAADIVNTNNSSSSLSDSIISQHDKLPEFNNTIIDLSNNVTPINSILEAPYERNKRFGNFMYFGTLWCSEISIPHDVNRLGSFAHVDTCCRDHYFCAINEKNYAESKHRVTLQEPFRSCYCDVLYHTCLKSANTLKSYRIGNKYFRDVAPKCISFDYPHVACLRWESRDIESRCVSYSIDKSQSVRAEIIDNLFYN